MNSLVAVSCVSYLNSLPFIHGLKNHDVKDHISLTLDIPSECARKLISGEAEIGLVPVAVIPLIKNAEIISDFCIGANGPVTSVMLFSEVPLHEIETVMLDYHSRTSVNLAKVLAHEYWKINPKWIDTTIGFENTINGRRAGVVIGDRALVLNGRFKYSYDLSDEWKKFTGLPFVFACWVANRKLSPEFINEFNDALRFGFHNIDHTIEESDTGLINKSEASIYLHDYIDYNFDEDKKKALRLFQRLISSAVFSDDQHF